ncbi:PAS domain S-box protein [Phenylobacterium sp.]|uniref:PAS domain S-box protein n=1 Tax=Phenylobacterium sp. TaxID=1871053 RepID=UPI003D2895A0
MFALALGAFGLAGACLAFIGPEDHVAAIWPANALALAVILRSPPRLWAAYAAAAAAGLMVANLAVGDSAGQAVLLAACNGGEILIAAALASRLTARDVDVTEPRQLLALCCVAAAAPIVPALMATAVLGEASVATLIRWYLASALGLAVVTPALLALVSDAGSLKATFRRRRNFAPLAMLVAAWALAFGQETFPLYFLLFPPLVWCAMTLRSAGNALVLLLTGIVAVTATLTGHGMAGLIDEDMQTKLAVLQGLLATMTFSTLPLTALLARQRRLNASLRDALAQVGKSEERYRLLADNASDIVITIDDRGILTYVSPSIRQLGHAPEDMIGQSPLPYIHPDDREAVGARMRERRLSGEFTDAPHQTYRILKKDGGFTWVEGKPSVIRNAQGGISAVISQLRDVTARMEAEAALAESEARYRMLADHSTDIILKVDAADTILYVSPSVSRYGYTPEQLIGVSGYSLVHPDDLPTAQARIAELFGDGVVDATRDRAHRIRTASGHYVWMEGNPSLVPNAQGEVEAVISQMRDVSVRKGLEAELLAARDEAQAVAATKAEFMANMSHEVRTPLTAVLGFTGLLASRDDLAADARRQVERIGAAGQAMLAIVNDVLDFSKLEAGLMPVTPRPTAPLEVLETALALFEPQAEAKGLRLSFEASDLPAHVGIDPDRTRQVLLNLIGNAVKFTDDGEVAVSAIYADGRLKVSVRDSGAGMTEAQQARLFQRFSQVDGDAARAGGGTGLGLAICRGLVEAMGGEIGLTSAVGQGSTFTFEIPAPVCAAAAGPEEASPLAGVAGLRVLVVDDNPTNRELAHAVMAQFGVEVTDACDGAEAVELAAQWPYDVILLDIRMPVMDGPTAARRIRGEPGPNRDTPILAFSADHQLDETVSGLFDGHVRKPMEVTPLLEALVEATAWEDALYAAEG